MGQFGWMYLLARKHNIVSDFIALIYFIAAAITLLDFRYAIWLFYFPLTVAILIHLLLAATGIGLCIYSLIRKRNAHLIVFLNLIYAAAALGLFLLTVTSFRDYSG